MPNSQIVTIKDIKKSDFAQNLQDLAQVYISPPQKPGAGANWEAFQMCRAHFLEFVLNIWLRIHLSEQRLIHQLHQYSK